jgi:hypothetical protein
VNVGFDPHSFVRGVAPEWVPQQNADNNLKHPREAGDAIFSLHYERLG